MFSSVSQQSSTISKMARQLLASLVAVCLFPINYAFVATGNPAFGSCDATCNNKQAKNVIGISSSTSSDDDVQDFHQYAAASVELSDAHISNDMHSNSAPGMKSYEERCPIDPNAKKAWEPGDLDQMFHKLTSEPYKTKYDVTILSSPPDGPWVITMDNVLSLREAHRLIELGHDAGYERSTEVGKVHDDGSVDTDVTKARTSTNAWCMEETCVKDDVTIRVIERLSNFTNIPETNCDYIQLLRYEPDQYYHTHHDYIQHHIERQYGVRLLTVYLYLNDMQAGGGTNFDKLDLTVQPKAGRALLWPSTLNESPNEIDERTTHQALPVESGIKYGANMWFHQFDLKTPEANDCIE